MYALPGGKKVDSKSKRTKQEERREDGERDIKIQSMLEMRGRMKSKRGENTE